MSSPQVSIRAARESGDVGRKRMAAETTGFNPRRS